jgi:hypothetical protein
MYLDAEQAAMRERQQSNQRRLEQEQAQEDAAVQRALAASNGGRNRKKLRAALALPDPPIVMSEPLPITHVTLAEAKERWTERLKHAKPIPSVTANQALLRNFKQESKGLDQLQKLTLLQTYAAIVVVLRDDHSLRQARRSFNSIKHSRFKLEGSSCWVCGNAADVRHHIIQLQHGGLMTAAKNIRFLCNSCHTEIHPWLAAPIRPMTSGIAMLNNRIESVSDLFRDASNGLMIDQKAIEDAALKVLDYFFSVVNILKKDHIALLAV